MTQKKIPFYFTVDFEDFHYDALRHLNMSDPPCREKALIKSYQRIKDICKQYLDNKKITFFVTGIVARKLPSLIKQIYDDGHEIGCHYNYHEDINKSYREHFAKNLDQAIESIENAIGEKPIGFRAANFAIDESNIWAYEELSKRFVYDSSFKTSKNISFLYKNKNFEYMNNKLIEFFIYEMPIMNNFFKIRSGGTFLRLFHSNLIIKALKLTNKEGHVPILYIHPYELTLNHDFWIEWNEIAFLPFRKRLYTWLRQTQWSHLGHKSVERKIYKICKVFEHQGPMSQLIKK